VNVGDVQVGGYLTDGLLKELMPPMPVMYMRCVEIQPTWEASAVGYLRHDPGLYDCPVYSTNFRGPTFVFLAQLTSKVDTSKWVLSGTALILQQND